MGSPSLPGDKTYKHGVETNRFPVIQKVQDGKSAGKLYFETT